jgi:purine-binding chemotaxis protein CheW
MENQYVVFELAGESYAVDIARVESIIKMQKVTHMPQAPWFVQGITNLRGSILPVVDLRKRLGLPEGEMTKESRIIVARLDGLKAGMIVDGVSEVLTISADAVEPTPPMARSIDAAYIVGIVKLTEASGTGRLVIVLDLARVLSLDEQAQVAELAA